MQIKHGEEERFLAETRAIEKATELPSLFLSDDHLRDSFPGVIRKVTRFTIFT